MSELLLALDFGGTKLSAAVLRRGERGWLALHRSFSPPGANAETDIQGMLALARQALDGGTPAAVGVSFGGPVDANSGTVRLSHHVPGWENTPLAAMLQAEFAAPAGVDNDANVAALGEHVYGAGSDFAHLMYITVSTGVGGGWILNGQPWRGSEGMAGEIGHVVVDPSGPACLCGKRGCVERLASGPYMAQDAVEILRDQPERGRRLLDLAGGSPMAITGQVLARAANSGDELSAELIKRSAWALGVGIGNTANLINPQRFVLGGGVTKSGEGWWEIVRRTARQTALPEVHFDVVPAELGDDAPLWGAVALAESLVPG